ncbi:hypothetical protein T11_11294 [Trichinella zimbabwensis]|uniref:Uncharacterized protein n=1 Tax=Trichinella zimbabwensis TaxID=268475 RepID=A0A0V1GLQ0_9BILA|nr:hypothetical protein T11_2580 [Trichinella zimbabwensis]KRY99025.1 hypothetical protein T11_11294 [Trichinella zimbabwensis]
MCNKYGVTLLKRNDATQSHNCSQKRLWANKCYCIHHHSIEWDRETSEFNGNRGILHLFFTVKNFYK